MNTNTSNITTRPLQTADLQQIHDVALISWQGTYHGVFEPAVIAQYVQTYYHPDQLRSMLALIERGETFFEVALDGQQIVGFCQIGFTPQGAARLFRIYLLPAYVGRGIGGTLVRRGEAWLGSKGVPEYGCYVHSANAVGKQFYERQGFIHRPEQDQDEEWYMHKRLPWSQRDQPQQQP
jgi:ribosomal protein S18 acetylase RimI-like enzyme